MTRGERRNINKSKWFKKLKALYKSKAWDWYRLVDKYVSDFKTFDGRTIEPKEWKDLIKTKDGKAYKETGTIWHRPKTDKNYYTASKDIHKRDKINKSLSKDDKEELNQYLEDVNDQFAFEKYCGSCDNFEDIEKCPFYDKVENQTIWKNIGCKKFWN